MGITTPLPHHLTTNTSGFETSDGRVQQSSRRGAGWLELHWRKRDNGKPPLGLFFFLFIYLFLIFYYRYDNQRRPRHVNDHDHTPSSTPTPPTPPSLQPTPKPLNTTKRRWQQQQQGLETQRASLIAGNFFLGPLNVSKRRWQQQQQRHHWQRHGLETRHVSSCWYVFFLFFIYILH